MNHNAAYLFILSLTLFRCSPSIKKQIVTNISNASEAKILSHQSYKNSICDQANNYQPDTNYLNSLPVKWIRVNVHFIQPSEGDKFTKDEGTQYAISMISVANEYLAHNQKMNLPADNTTPVLPTRIRYDLCGSTEASNDIGIYFHTDDSLFTYNKKDNSNQFSKRQFEKYGREKGSKINIFMLEHPPDSILSQTYKASKDGIGAPYFIKLAGAYQSFKEENEDGDEHTGGGWQIARLLNHEAGHSLGLGHTWRSGGDCEDTPPNPNCWEVTPNGKCKAPISNNVMDYNNCQCAYSPCQIGKIHYGFHRQNSKTADLLVKAWCKKNETLNVSIKDSIVWQSHKYIHGDIYIEDNASLEIQCSISMPKDGTIVIKPNGKLILNGCRIYNDCENKWNGIEIQSRGSQKGALEVFNHSLLENTY